MATKRSWGFRLFLFLAVPFLLSACGFLGEDDLSWTLEWSDEFNGTELDETVWNYDIGTGSAQGLTGWGNNELEYYTSRAENIRIEDFDINGETGRGLVIEAREESYGGMDYTSARINTKDKLDFTYGKIEARIKLPVEEGNSKGIWPAFWMLGSNIDDEGWPVCGEIDIMEIVGSDPDRVHGNLHYGDPWQYTGSLTDSNHYDLDTGDFGDEFHLFSVEWTAGEVKWLVDDEVYYAQSNWYSSLDGSNAPFDRPFYLLLNVAVGGNWPGSPDGNTTFPKQMTVDYVRVYKQN